MKNPVRECALCGEGKSASEFYPGRAQCKDCVKARVIAYGAANPEKKKKWQATCRRNIKVEVLTYYGGGSAKCKCCGEAAVEFLTLDHVAGDGNIERRNGWRAGRLWYRLKREGFPPGYRVLCFNCNCARGAFGTCPHEFLKQVGTLLP